MSLKLLTHSFVLFEKYLVKNLSRHITWKYKYKFLMSFIQKGQFGFVVNKLLPTEMEHVFHGEKK